MSEYSFNENEYLVVGWAQGLMDTEEEDANGKKVNVQRPYYQLFVLSPVSSCSRSGPDWRAGRPWP